ncbi:MAG: murein biosynthesis integral membrane protein MurJ [Clostridia bacterium]|jgi:putative peptidoglycan lipid II flippase
MSDDQRQTSDDTPASGRLMRESGKLSVLTMVSRVLGLVRDATRANLMGTGLLGEAFTVAFNTPNLFRRLLAEGSMSVALIPTLRTYLSEGDEQQTEDFLSSTFTILIIVVGAVVAMGMAGSSAIAHLYASVGRQPDVAFDALETAVLMRIMFPFLALVSIAAFLQGILNAHGVFGPSGMAPILFNVCFIVVPVLFGPVFGNPARAMAAGVLVGGVAQALCQLPAVIRSGSRFRFVHPVVALRNPGMRKVLTLVAPTILGMAAYELNAFVSTALAAGVGAATSVGLSIRLQELVLGVFVVSVGTVLLPELSGLAADSQWKPFVGRFRQALEAVMLVSVPVAVFSIIERVDIVTLLFKRGAFDEASVQMTADAFFYHTLGLVFIAANRIIAPVFYARKDTRSPTWAGMAAFGVNILVAVALSPVMRGSGIALALSIASAVNMLIYLWMLSRMRLDGMGQALAGAAVYALKLGVFSAIAALPVVLARPVLDRLVGNHPSRFVSAGLPFVLAALVFGGIGILLLVLTRDKVAAFLFDAFRHRSKRRSN